MMGRSPWDMTRVFLDLRTFYSTYLCMLISWKPEFSICCKHGLICAYMHILAHALYLPVSAVQLQLQGDSLTACGICSSGEEIGFGTDAGYMHLWSLSAEPCVNQYSQPLDVPLKRPGAPAVPLTEDDSFALAAVYPPGQVLTDK